MDPFDADPIDVGNWHPILEVRKKPVVVHAVQLHFPEGFDVTTMEGKLHGKPGDYLMIGINGEKYPIDKKIFEQTYEVISTLTESSRVVDKSKLDPEVFRSDVNPWNEVELILEELMENIQFNFDEDLCEFHCPWCQKASENHTKIFHKEECPYNQARLYLKRKKKDA